MKASTAVSTAPTFTEIVVCPLLCMSPIMQAAIALVKKSITDFPLNYGNFRD
jgi:hypothetical protein